jgi:uncharacterized protein YeaO (DUF488 family)
MTQAKPTSATQQIRLKRVYDPPENSDGFRVLVDRLWPRGLHKDRAALDLWCKDIAPSDSLRKWFGHDPRRFAEFRRRYWQELERNPGAVADLEAILEKHPVVTLLYSARDPEHNQAVVLREFLLKRAGRKP